MAMTIFIHIYVSIKKKEDVVILYVHLRLGQYLCGNYGSASSVRIRNAIPFPMAATHSVPPRS